jgi:hypothetical protein
MSDRFFTYTASIDGIADDARCHCDDCDWKGVFSDLKDIDDCSLTPGDPSPAGRCPECDTMAYIVKPEEERATPAEIEAARDNYAIGSDDNIEIDDGALVSRGDEGCFVQAWVWLKYEEENNESCG